MMKGTRQQIHYRKSKRGHEAANNLGRKNMPDNNELFSLMHEEHRRIFYALGSQHVERLLISGYIMDLHCKAGVIS